MTLISPRSQLIASLVLAGGGLFLFFSGDYQSLAQPLGFVGIWLFVAAVWFMVDAVQRVPASEAELAIAPREWLAWVGLAFLTALVVSMLQNAGAFAAFVPIRENPDAAAAGRRIGMLFVAWLVLNHVLRQRWKGSVETDERDRQIEWRASNWGRCAITVLIIGVAVLLGFSPTSRLQQFSYPLIAHWLMLAMLCGAWLEHAVAAVLYRGDRAAVAP